MSRGSWDLGVSKELEMVEKRMRELVDSPQKALTDVSLHVIGAGGKRVRPALSILSHHALDGNDVEKLIDIAAAMELIHSATLVHDDINDEADIRRGKKAAYKQFGLHEAIVTGDFLFARAFYVGGQFSKKIVELIADSTAHLAEGEMMQYAHKWDSTLSVDQYLKIIEGKTAYPIMAAAEVGGSIAEGRDEFVEALGEYGMNLGIAFQIVDDILDISGDERKLGKGTGTDIREGNMTLPLILARDEDKAFAKQIKTIYKAGKITDEQVSETLDMIKDTCAVREALKTARGYADGATEYLQRLPDSKYRSKLVDLSRLVVDRTN
jgi:octaprenyl-diphosphate synthase